MTSAEDGIIRAVKGGHVDEFAQLVDHHSQRVYAMLMRLVGDPQTAEELAQETFVRAYRGLSRFRGDSTFATWLTQIAVHLARDHVRKRQRNRFVSLDAMLEHDADALVFADTRQAYDPLEEISERETAEQFKHALSELPPNYREVFVLHHLQDMSYDDIAAVTGDSVGSLKVRAHRARKLIKQALFPAAGREAPQDVTD